jgi:excisionase family DNA binding protein
LVVVRIIDVNGEANLGVMMTVNEVASTLGLSTATVRRRISEGQLEAFRVGRGEGRSLRIPARAVDALLEPAISERDE